MRAIRLLAISLCALLLAGVAPLAAQDKFPSKPITLIVPWNAGGSTDILYRGMAEVVAKQLGQPVIVDNKPGGTGTLGPATMALTAKPDGYTIAQIPVTVLRLPLMNKHHWDPLKDFTWIIHQSGYILGVTARTDGPFKTWPDVVNYAKDNPGKVTYSTTGPGGTLHIGMEQIATKSGVKFTMVPFKGGAETNAAIAGGHVMLQVDSTVWRPLVDAGTLRVLMLWTPERVKNYPDVPTLKELGYPFVFDSPFGLAGPKGMDPAVVKRLHDAFKVAQTDAKVVDLMTKYDFIDRYMTSEDYAKFVPQLLESERSALAQIGLLKKE
jgi:tripartite-type tricarboxylate transporter receptor subunit TctC